MGFSYVRTWTAFVYVAFIVDAFSQRNVAWHAVMSMHTDRVMTPRRMAFWERDRTGHPIGRGQLIAHSDAGSQHTSLQFTEQHELQGVAPSTGPISDACDNALMETRPARSLMSLTPQNGREPRPPARAPLNVFLRRAIPERELADARSGVSYSRG